MFRSARSIGLSLLVAAVLCAVPGGSQASPAAEMTASVSITSSGFSPQNVNIDVGGTVTWTNTSGADQSVTSEVGIFDSGTIRNGSTFQLVFSTPGIYAYRSSGNQQFRGTVTVGGSSAGGQGMPPGMAQGQQQGMQQQQQQQAQGPAPLYSGGGQQQAMGPYGQPPMGPTAQVTTTTTVRQPERYNPLTNYGGNGYGDYGVYCSTCGFGGIFRGYLPDYAGYGYGGGYGYGYNGYGGYGYGGYGGCGWGYGGCGGYGYSYYPYAYGGCGGCGWGGYGYGYVGCGWGCGGYSYVPFYSYIPYSFYGYGSGCYSGCGYAYPSYGYPGWGGFPGYWGGYYGYPGYWGSGSSGSSAGQKPTTR